jgi:hypothetical protein
VLGVRKNKVFPSQGPCAAAIATLDERLVAGRDSASEVFCRVGGLDARPWNDLNGSHEAIVTATSVRCHSKLPANAARPPCECRVNAARVSGSRTFFLRKFKHFRQPASGKIFASAPRAFGDQVTNAQGRLR